MEFKPVTLIKEVINCHHSFVEKEWHEDQHAWITRKDAIRARADELGIILGSMGAQSYIIRGKGNQEPFSWCWPKHVTQSR